MLQKSEALHAGDERKPCVLATNESLACWPLQEMLVDVPRKPGPIHRYGPGPIDCLGHQRFILFPVQSPVR